MAPVMVICELCSKGPEIFFPLLTHVLFTQEAEIIMCGPQTVTRGLCHQITMTAGQLPRGTTGPA